MKIRESQFRITLGDYSLEFSLQFSSRLHHFRHQELASLLEKEAGSIGVACVTIGFHRIF
jgi:hypothetical protein